VESPHLDMTFCSLWLALHLPAGTRSIALGKQASIAGGVMG
jgi:hypothetical protein